MKDLIRPATSSLGSLADSAPVFMAGIKADQRLQHFVRKHGFEQILTWDSNSHKPAPRWG